MTNNELFVLHVDDEIPTPTEWRNLFRESGVGSSWKQPKRIYVKFHHAKSAVRQLPTELQKRTTIVVYKPIGRKP